MAVEHSSELFLDFDSGGHKARIWEANYVDSDRYIVSAGDDKTVRLWNAASGQTEKVLRGQIGENIEGVIYSAIVSPNLKYLVSSAYFPRSNKLTGMETKGLLRLYDFSSQEMLQLLNGHDDTVLDAEFSSDSQYLATSGFGPKHPQVLLWDVVKREYRVITHDHEGPIYKIKFANGNKWVITGGSDGKVSVWDRGKEQVLPTKRAHRKSPIRALDASDTKEIFATADTKGVVLFWDYRNLLFRRFITLGKPVYSLKFTPDGERIVVCFGETNSTACHVYSTKSKKRLAQYFGHDDLVLALDISENGERVLSAGGFRSQIDEWDIKTGERIRRLVGAGYVAADIGFSTNDSQLVWNNSKTSETISLNIGDERVEFRFAIKPGQTKTRNNIRSKYENRSIKKDKGNAGILNILEGRNEIGTIRRRHTDGDLYEQRVFSYTPDGALIVTGGTLGWLTAYDKTGKWVGEFKGHTGAIRSIAFSSNGRLLASSALDQTIRIWNIASQELVVTVFHRGDGEWVVWTKGGHFAATPRGEVGLGWQRNIGFGRQPEFVTAHQLRKKLYSPTFVKEHVRQVLTETEVPVERFETTVSDLISSNSGPPDFMVISPAQGQVVRTKSLTLIIEKVAGRSPAKNIKIIRNGSVLVDVSENGISTQSFEIELIPGRNRIELIAYNDTYSTTRLLTTELQTEKPQVLGDLYVVAVGVNDVQEFGPDKDLKFAEKDARVFRATITTNGRGVFRNVYFPKAQEHLAGDVDSIRRAFNFLENASANDTSILFLAGHGILEDKKYFYLTTDAVTLPNGKWNKETVISWDAILSVVETLKGKIILLVDTCHSENGFSQFAINDAQATGIHALFATGNSNWAKENPEIGHGNFSYAVVEGLTGRANTSHGVDVKGRILPKDRFVSFLELENFVYKTVVNLTRGEQKPYFLNSRSITDFNLSVDTTLR